MKTTIYTARDVRNIARNVGLTRLMDDAIAALSDALLDYDKSASITPAREGFKYDDPESGLIEWMPALTAGKNALIKIVGYHPTNPQNLSLPTILSSAMTLDTRSGQLLSLVDTTFLTALRTGAASAVASRILARADSRVLGLVGAGTQSITQLHALSRVFELEQVIIYDTDKTALESFAQRAKYLEAGNLSISTGSLEKLCQEADIICTATSVENGRGPVIEDEMLRESVHINAVGSDFPGKTEIPLSLLQRSLVCPDFLPQARHEGECQQLQEGQVGPDLVELVKNATKYATHRNRPTVFDSTGWALEDYVVVSMLIDLGQKLGCGTPIELTNITADPKSPYQFIEAEEDTLDEHASQVVYALGEKIALKTDQTG